MSEPSQAHHDGAARLSLETSVQERAASAMTVSTAVFSPQTSFRASPHESARSTASPVAFFQDSTPPCDVPGLVHLAELAEPIGEQRCYVDSLLQSQLRLSAQTVLEVTLSLRGTLLVQQQRRIVELEDELRRRLAEVDRLRNNIAAVERQRSDDDAAKQV